MQRQGCHLQAGNPPLGALFQRRDRRCIQAEIHDLVQELGCLLLGKAKLGSPELDGALDERIAQAFAITR